MRIFIVTDRETKAHIGEFHEENKLLGMAGSRLAAVEYLEKHPDATLIISEMHDRVWKCKTTGKYRTDTIKDLEE